MENNKTGHKRIFAKLAFAFSLVLFLSLFSNTAFGQTTCKLTGCDLEITIKIAFSGTDDAYINRMANEIESVWNGPDGFQTTGECKCNVTFNVETMKITDPAQVNCNPPPAGYHCVMVTSFNTNPPKDTNGTTYVAYMYGVSHGGQSANGWWSDVMSRSVEGGTGETYKDAAHEAGHMMGLEDGDGNGLMTNTSGPNSDPTQDNIDTAVKNVCGANACPDRCCCGNGVINKDKGESCDPFASPVGCKAGESCCPVCCSCFRPACDLTKGSYATQAECKTACGEDARCYYNYKTGCWDCVKDNVVVEIVYDPEKTRQIIEGAHGPLDQIHPALEEIRPLFESLASVPVLSDLIFNNKANVYVEGYKDFSLVFENGKLIEINEALVSDPTVNIRTDIGTVQDIIDGKTTIVSAIQEGRAVYEPVGILNAITNAVSGFFFGIFSFFTDLI